ncbi:BaiN/RdsA family NAD(P)/FAD-dependent oxidoreductase [Ponticaulis profundi]|uniref:NAD(P)/FAD-dependent oxidoreductase n=1 Tax=Ponticaulis profundi TaxID=2665222 RepID=A0ABW1S7B6_9PROT
MSLDYDVIIIGAGAAGLFAGSNCTKRGLSTLVVDHAAKPAEKIRISGGGRCNFTNLETDAKRFLSENPHFAKSALARFTPWDFIALMAEHGLTYHEKTLGQLFCDQKSGAIIKMLLDELEKHGGTLQLSTDVRNVRKSNDQFSVQTSTGELRARHVIIATGGLSIPKIGASGFGYEIARQFGHDIVETRPGLVPFTFSGQTKERFASLSGVATNVDVESENGTRFHEAMLFTHRGLSGPAILQISSYWSPGEPVHVDFLPGTDLSAQLTEARHDQPRKKLSDLLAQWLPNRLVADLLAELKIDKRAGDLSNKDIALISGRLQNYALTPTQTEGYRTAEVTVGGVDTAGLSSKTMESRHCPGLYFIGEVVDVTGWLGGYNFQWAWASAHAAAMAIAEAT